MLKMYDARGNNQHTDGAVSKLTQSEAARSAGISERQQVTAVRVASVPEQSFNEAVEAARPATVGQLAAPADQKNRKHRALSR